MVNIYSTIIEARSVKQAIRKFHKKAGNAYVVISVVKLKEDVIDEH